MIVYFFFYYDYLSMFILEALDNTDILLIFISMNIGNIK